MKHRSIAYFDYHETPNIRLIVITYVVCSNTLQKIYDFPFFNLTGFINFCLFHPVLIFKAFIIKYLLFVCARNVP
jgi:hypothetical protein